MAQTTPLTHRYQQVSNMQLPFDFLDGPNEESQTINNLLPYQQQTECLPFQPKEFHQICLSEHSVEPVRELPDIEIGDVESPKWDQEEEEGSYSFLDENLLSIYTKSESAKSMAAMPKANSFNEISCQDSHLIIELSKPSLCKLELQKTSSGESKFFADDVFELGCQD